MRSKPPGGFASGDADLRIGQQRPPTASAAVPALYNKLIAASRASRAARKGCVVRGWLLLLDRDSLSSLGILRAAGTEETGLFQVAHADVSEAIYANRHTKALLMRILAHTTRRGSWGRRSKGGHGSVTATTEEGPNGGFTTCAWPTLG